MKNKLNKKTLDSLNKLLKLTYNYGWQVGRSWDYNWAKKNCLLNGYLKNDSKIEKSLNDVLTKLLEELNLNSDIIVYTKEDCSTHENDWDYISPLIEIKK